MDAQLFLRPTSTAISPGWTPVSRPSKIYKLAVVARQGSSTPESTDAQPSQTSEQTAQPTNTSSSAGVPASSQTSSQPNTSSDEETSSPPSATSTSARETPTSSSNTSASPSSTTQQPATTTTHGEPTPSTQSQTPGGTETSTRSATTPTSTSRGESSTLVSNGSTSTSLSSPLSSTTQNSLPTSVPQTTGSSNAPASTNTSNASSAPATVTVQSTSTAETTSSLTSVLITVTSEINGTKTTFTTFVPTLAAPPRGSGLSSRTTSIVGGVIGGTFALLAILLALFYVGWRRRKTKAAQNNPRLQAPRQLLDNDDFDLADPAGPAPYAYGVVGARASPNASGSIFHEDLPGTATHHSRTHTRSVISESDPLLSQHMRRGYHDTESTSNTSPRESVHFRGSSTTGLLYDPNDPFSDVPSDASSTRGIKARETRPQHAHPPSSFHGPLSESTAFPMRPLGSSMLPHQDPGRTGGEIASSQ